MLLELEIGVGNVLLMDVALGSQFSFVVNKGWLRCIHVARSWSSASLGGRILISMFLLPSCCWLSCGQSCVTNGARFGAAVFASFGLMLKHQSEECPQNL
ncbi:hypothetical protein Nepgr_012435 [Nepenthes gracilis]|uniref:Uncharacterized protein n=1 Tax=Nepenthes gracilis TaxID=150966 RepID=A0AAD3SHA1_NEPGR|nr:hypothetical protein Nepgr_012435 [Nepenthes gracilis]